RPGGARGHHGRHLGPPARPDRTGVTISQPAEWPDVGDFLDPEEGLSRHELRQLQEDRLLAMLPYVYERSALTRSVWDKAGVQPRDIRSISDVRERAPFLDQNALRAFRAQYGDPFAGLLCVRPRDLGYVGSTSGTTGNPTPVAHTPMGPTEIARGRELHMLGARPGD